MTAELDTIAAIATAPGEAGIAVVRVSGPRSLAIGDRLVQEGVQPPSGRPGGTFFHARIRGASGDALDEAIVLVYRAPHSYTREDVLEIQTHGGRACAGRTLEAVLAAGARPAEPGEFTRRAFLNGRLDLLQAEAVADLIRARSDRAAAAALDQLEGSLSDWLTNIYNDLLNVTSDVEGTLDFPEEDLPDAVPADLQARLDEMRQRLEALLATWHEGRLLREGARVVIGGKPNVGKSTLFNRLVNAERVIVADSPGTTRDTIEETVVIDGIPVRLNDTAGLRESLCRIEREGVSRAQALIAQADVVLYVLDASEPLDPGDSAALARLPGASTIPILNKTDLGRRCEPPATKLPPLWVSLLTDTELPRIRAAIAETLSVHTDAPPHAVISQRHRTLVAQALQEVKKARSVLDEAGPADDMSACAASHTRSALDALAAVIGRATHEDMLDRIFSRFCIGK
ncbi:MAG: tRNA uridine-5-carboxymethylaminomethyl(34) synthesis GTPase MnmE [Lentisphaerae bacterium]|nr:tRNA uridine-5-carboxymethylaminomethyl(34) synthesis GTPase MnmE [Lentisphaerota bacterium]